MAPRITLLAAAAAVTALSVPPAALAANEQARSSAAFVDSVGVNVHSSFGNTPYNDHDRVLAKLRDLGIRHVRDGLNAPNASQAVTDRQEAFRRKLAEHGIKTQAILGFPGEDAASFIETLADEGTATLSGVEGANEWDLSGRSNWIDEVRAYQRALHEAKVAEPGLKNVPLAGPSLAHNDRAASLGDVGAWTDLANVHNYPGGRAPGTFDDGTFDIARKVSGGQTPIITETGYHNAMWQPGGHAPTSERATAVYLPKMFLENYRRGISRTFAYELINTHHDPFNMSANYHFGLLRNDWSEKPVAKTVRNLLKLVDPQEKDVAAGSLDYTLEGDLNGISRLLLRRADGTFAVVAWQTAPVWDAYGRRDLYPAAKTVKLRVAQPADLSIGRTSLGGDVQPVVKAATAMNVTIPADDVVVAVVKPEGTTTPAPAPAPEPTPTPTPDTSTPAPTPDTSTPAPAPQPAPAPAPTVKTVADLWRDAWNNLLRLLRLW